MTRCFGRVLRLLGVVKSSYTETSSATHSWSEYMYYTVPQGLICGGGVEGDYWLVPVLSVTGPDGERAKQIGVAITTQLEHATVCRPGGPLSDSSLSRPGPRVPPSLHLQSTPRPRQQLLPFGTPSTHRRRADNSGASVWDSPGNLGDELN